MRAEDEAEFKGYAAARMRDFRRTAFLLCGDRHHADDVAQAVLTKLYLNWEKVQRRDPARRVRPHHCVAKLKKEPFVATEVELIRSGANPVVVDVIASDDEGGTASRVAAPLPADSLVLAVAEAVAAQF